jgi:hypothetical protein
METWNGSTYVLRPICFTLLLGSWFMDGWPVPVHCSCLPTPEMDALILTQLDRHNAIIRTTGRPHQRLPNFWGSPWPWNKSGKFYFGAIAVYKMYFLVVFYYYRGAYTFLFSFQEKVREDSYFWCLPRPMHITTKFSGCQQHHR